ncbi:DUF1330 domain-containing protein [Sphingobium sp. JS3065]|uniref:DUF1330 domain-containing protein n=1 Tax=Sphingobium sp. JS3065 TaxID=2970925 RepID=UPI002264DB85|nr:DUF1330 domain-containing protein [Sphingobium sp. JS3065]UZW57040.1 DUF1330 domain-containing protein [Sphingobium sp. JS3065]
MPAAYVIGIRQRLKGKGEMKLYGQKALPTMTNTQIEALYGRHEVLEVDPIAGVTIVRFESYEAAKSWYESDEYKEAMKTGWQALTIP